MYVGTIYPGDKSLISKIKIFYNKEKKVDRRKKNILSIHSKLLEKGVYVRDCSDKIGLEGSFVRVASRSFEENLKIIDALKDALR